MGNDAIQSTSLGFENLALPGWKEQQRQAAAALREGKRQSQGDGKLSAEDQQRIGKLQAIDRKVRAHEQAHIAAGGELIRGGATFSYETGPDKKRYAVAGDVSIDISEGRTPDETIPKAGRIRDAALAPADPSAQDRQMASLASQMEMRARQELAMQAVEERARAEGRHAARAVGAYQAAGGLELSAGFYAEA